MVVVEDVLTDSLAACIQDWFDHTFNHPFIGLKTISVPDSEKPIPRQWVEDVEIADEGFGTEEADVMGQGPITCWSYEEGRKRMRDALMRLNLREEDLVRNAEMSKMSKAELSHEKKQVKQELKRYDAEFRKHFMRLPTHVEKEPMRVLYIYYRRVKSLLAQADLGRRRTSGTAATPVSDDEGPKLGPRDPYAGGDGGADGTIGDRIKSVEDRLTSLQAERAAVRAKLQAFLERFVIENNRKIRFHKDILPIERQYRAYKHLKEEIVRSEQQLRSLRAGGM